MKIVTSLTFKGNCREAFEFYARVLGGRITAAYPYGDGPPDMPIGPEYKDQLMHCWLEVGDQALMGFDGIPEFAPGYHQPVNGFDVTLHTHDPEQARGWYDALVEGGTPTMPFGETFWSPGYGGLVDRFGTPWMVNTMPSADWKPSQG
jgi:PhnB protein